MSKVKKEVFRKGDTVEVVNKLRFVRCGYPKTAMEYYEKIDEFNDRIYNFIDSLNVEKWRVSDYFDGRDQIVEDIRNTLARRMGYDDHFGGRERKMFEEPIHVADGKQFKVIGKKVVKTGYKEYGYRSEDDYEPAYLSKEKTYVIIQISSVSYPYQTFWTWEGNCKKIV